MIRHALLALIALAGCRAPGEVDCGDGTLCPPGTVCHAATQSCPSVAQVEACDGQPDEAACGYPGVPDGVCFDGVCLPAGCGNGELEDDEVCDDGNRDHGDGCAADCGSDETCGNGVTDIAVGEQCDDGNLVDGDGCQHDCADPRCGDGVIDLDLNEACDDGAANSLDPDAPCRPSCQPRRCGDGVLDELGGEVCDDGNTASADGCRADCASVETCGNGLVDFEAGEQCDDGDRGGADGCSQDCAVEVLGWEEHTLVTPQLDNDPSIADDLERGRVVVFGGNSDATWEWDGFHWEHRHPPVVPPVRSSAAMTYDLARHEVVMFGGQGSPPFDDTWTYDGETWTEHDVPGPPGRRDAAMAFDPLSQRVILHGGFQHQDTWAWDGTAWAALAPSGSPSAMFSAHLAYDTPRDRLVLVGATTSTPSKTETWALQAGTWSQLGVAIPPIVHPTLVFDARRGRLLLVDLDTGATRALVGTTWTAVASAPGNAVTGTYDATRGETMVVGGTTTTFDGAAWSDATPHGPDVRIGTALADDPRRGQVILFGGAPDLGGFFDDTWVWEVDRWRRPKTTGQPEGRLGHAIAYDAADDEVVMFGGRYGLVGGVLDDTWRYRDGAWSGPDVTPRPGARLAESLAYDPAHGQIVLFGGSDADSGSRSDTWTWAAGAWSSHLLVTRPAPRSGASMAYDPQTARVILQGGDGNNTTLHDTWAWDGASWSDVTPAVSPPVGRTMIVTHEAAAAPLLIDEDANAWLWDGAAWRLRLVSGPHPDPATLEIAYDAREREIVAFGDPSGSTWTLAWTSDARAEWCGTELDTDGDGLAGCADPDCEGWCATCGDAVCDPLETCWSCPGDCVTCDVCGDDTCETGETPASCHGDCD